MRIEGPSENTPIYHSTVPISKNLTSSDSIRYGKEVSSFWRIFSTIRRKVSNFFRWMLSFFLPIKRKAPVDINEIECENKSKKNGISENRILLHGKPTNNAIEYKKVGNFLHIEKLTFPDEEVHEHIGTFLGKILKKEKAEGFTTEYFETAKILRCSGFTTEDTISFGSDDENTNTRAINNMIDMASKKRETLNQNVQDALDRISKAKTQAENAIFGFTCIHPNTTIALSDLFTLMDAVDVGSRPGISFGTMTFKKADVN